MGHGNPQGLVYPASCMTSVMEYNKHCFLCGIKNHNMPIKKNEHFRRNLYIVCMCYQSVLKFFQNFVPNLQLIMETEQLHIWWWTSI